MSSKAARAVDLPAPERPVIKRKDSRDAGIWKLFERTPQGLVEFFLGEDFAVQTILEFLSGKMPLLFEQVVSSRHFENGGDVSTRPYGDLQERDLDIEDDEFLFVDAEAVIFFMGIPFHKLHNDLNDLVVPSGGDPEEIFDVDDSQPADLHVMLDDTRSHASQGGGGFFLDLHDIIGHKPVSPENEVQGALAFADSTFSGDEDSHAEDVHQDPMNGGGGGEFVLQKTGHAVDK